MRATGTAGSIETVFLLLIFVMPFVAAPPMAARIFDIPGLKLPNLVAALAFLIFLGTQRPPQRPDKLYRGALVAFSAYLAFFTFAFVRSLPNVARFHSLLPESFQAGLSEYWQSYYAVPVLFAFSFVYVLQRMCSREGLLLSISAICAAIFVLSCAIIAVMLSHPDAIMNTDPSRTAISKLTGAYLGLHYNGAGTMYVIAGPLLLYMSLTRGSFWTVNLVAALAAVLLLKSRTAIFTFAAMGAMTFIILGRTKILAAIAPLVLAGGLTVLGRVVVQLLSMGITKGGISTFALFSGREQAIWLPLLAEWLGDPNRLMWGAGLFGLMTSNFLYSVHSIFPTGEAHNFYLEFFLDNGIIMFAIFAVLLIGFLTWSWRLGRRLHTPLYWVLFLCVVSFLIAGFTGRRYFPESENFLMFPVLAMMINAARLKLRDPNFTRSGKIDVVNNSDGFRAH